MEALLIVATLYAGPYIGQETFCGGTYGDGVALPRETWGEDWQCFDWIVAWTTGSDGQEYMTFAQVVDAGPFGNNCVMQPNGSCASIALDIPNNLWYHGRDISAKLTFYMNVSAEGRKGGAW